ncbi:MAG: response regulator [Provencibacterium sp.]|jgi:hemerythrin-like metal-binding protein|nr:response regulator [Provencibacterium sp.]
MDAEFVWQQEYNIGVEIIDKEHQRLFKIINKLFTLRKEEKDSQWACQEGIKFFKSHTMKHFTDEEAYMKSVSYEGLEQHRRIHNGFREITLPTLEQELERAAYSPDAVDHFLGICAGWLIGHTLTEDLAITGKSERKWEALLPGEELTAIKKVIVQIVFDMFHLESQMISDAYNGERFGRGVYYRLIYGTDQSKEKQEIVLVFEEKLLINTVGKVMGIKTNKLDNMLVHATRYTARQFVERVIKHFPAKDSYELKEENLLTYEEFQKVFQGEKLQVSLLFNTGGAGYFAFCAIAPHLLQNGIGTPIEAGNAMSEVEKYLAERKRQETAEAKPKVLVVDDSATILQGMKQLLSGDYEVALAESGVAAIRIITLNQPDLVLLDYEMPVCNGRQTLEMLRSEKEFADIPVIFLTSRRDRESMIEVMPLKPAGYLLKSTKPADIKKEIDKFFAKKKA